MINWGNFRAFFTTGIPSSVLYSSLLVMTIALIIIFFSRQLKNKGKMVLWTLLIEYLFILACSTVICRGVMKFSFDRLELTPFWTYWAVANNTLGVSVWDIVLNVVLFTPLGLLMKLIYLSISLLKLFFVALICSLSIEINQYIFEKGVTQLDDVMHNVIGAILGWSISKYLILSYIKKFRNNI